MTEAMSLEDREDYFKEYDDYNLAQYEEDEGYKNVTEE